MKNLSSLGFSIIVIILVIFVLSCEKNEVRPDSGLILGKWDWIETVSPWTGIKYTPQTEGYTQSLEFIPHGIIKVFKNDALVRTGTFKIVSGPVNTNYFILAEDSGDSSRHIYLTRDTLQFNSAYIDGPVILYVRSR
jgi:hypothetical protein